MMQIQYTVRLQDDSLEKHFFNESHLAEAGCKPEVFNMFYALFLVNKWNAGCTSYVYFI